MADRLGAEVLEQKETRACNTCQVVGHIAKACSNIENIERKTNQQAMRVAMMARAEAMQTGKYPWRATEAAMKPEMVGGATTGALAEMVGGDKVAQRSTRLLTTNVSIARSRGSRRPSVGQPTPAPSL